MQILNRVDIFDWMGIDFSLPRRLHYTSKGGKRIKDREHCYGQTVVFQNGQKPTIPSFELQSDLTIIVEADR